MYIEIHHNLRIILIKIIIVNVCFEEVMNILSFSSLFDEKDNMKDVSANILDGKF